MMTNRNRLLINISSKKIKGRKKMIPDITREIEEGKKSLRKSRYEYSLYKIVLVLTYAVKVYAEF